MDEVKSSVYLSNELASAAAVVRALRLPRRAV